MSPETKQALKTFWKYAFRSYRVSSRTEFLFALKWHIIPFLLLFSMRNTIETQLGLKELASGNSLLSFLLFIPGFGYLLVAPICLNDN